MSDTPIPPAQTDALAKLAEIPPAGSEERRLWLSMVRRHGFQEEADEAFYATKPVAILTLMSEARKQGQRDVLGATPIQSDPAALAVAIEDLEGTAAKVRAGASGDKVAAWIEMSVRDIRAALATRGAESAAEQALREIISCADDYKVYAASGVMGAAVASATDLRKRTDAAMANGRAALATGGAR